MAVSQTIVVSKHVQRVMQPLQCCITLHVQRCCNEAVTEVLKTCLTSLINWPTCQFLLLFIAASKTLNLRGLECH